LSGPDQKFLGDSIEFLVNRRRMSIITERALADKDRPAASDQSLVPFGTAELFGDEKEAIPRELPSTASTPPKSAAAKAQAAREELRSSLRSVFVKKRVEAP